MAELGVTNATRFVMELSEGEQDYAKLRGKLFANKSLDELYAEIQRVQRSHRGARLRSISDDYEGHSLATLRRNRRGVGQTGPDPLRSAQR